MQQPLLNSFKKNLRTVSTLLLRQSCHAFSWPGIHYGAEVSLKLTATILRFLSAGIIGCATMPPPFLMLVTVNINSLSIPYQQSLTLSSVG